jgi:hypothetical protein
MMALRKRQYEIVGQVCLTDYRGFTVTVSVVLGSKSAVPSDQRSDYRCRLLIELIS